MELTYARTRLRLDFGWPQDGGREEFHSIQSDMWAESYQSISHRVSGRAGMHVRVGGGLVSLLEAVLSAALRSLMLDGYISRKQK